MQNFICPLPDWNSEGIIEPFPSWEESLPVAWLSSPYLISMDQFVGRFGWNSKREEILGDFFALRSELRHKGFERGFHLISGNFLDNSETTENINPEGIDILTVLYSTAKCRAFLDEDAGYSFSTHSLLPLGEFLPKRCNSTIIELHPKSSGYEFEKITRILTNWVSIHGLHRITKKMRALVQVDFENSDRERVANSK